MEPQNKNGNNKDKIIKIKVILNKKEGRNYHQPDFRLYYRAIVRKTACHWPQTDTDQWNRIKLRTQI